MSTVSEPPRPDEVPLAPTGAPVRSPRVALATFIGSTIENYDFLLYGTASALVFDKVFFPTYSPTTGVLAALAANAVGFAARPLGGFIAGHVGDRVGRKTLLVASILCMGIPTTLIGLLPTYQQAGLLAPILLVVLRLLQGVGLGTEFGGAATLASEHARSGHRGIANSFNGLGSPGGLILSTALFFAVREASSPAAFLSWGWRIPFLFSAVLVVVGVVVRMTLADGPAFATLKARGETVAAPLVEVFRRHAKGVLVGVGIRMLQNSLYWLLAVFSLSYLRTVLGSASNVALVATLVASAISFVTLPAMAALSDRVGRRPVYLVGVVSALVGMTLFFAGAETRNIPLIVVGLVVAMNLGHDGLAGPLYVWLSEMFSTATRSSGASLSFQLSAVLAGGLAPLVAVALLAVAGPWSVLTFIVGLAVISTAAALWSDETSRLEIDQLDDPSPPVAATPQGSHT